MPTGDFEYDLRKDPNVTVERQTKEIIAEMRRLSDFWVTVVLAMRSDVPFVAFSKFLEDQKRWEYETRNKP